VRLVKAGFLHRVIYSEHTASLSVCRCKLTCGCWPGMADWERTEFLSWTRPGVYWSASTRWHAFHRSVELDGLGDSGRNETLSEIWSMQTVVNAADRQPLHASMDRPGWNSWRQMRLRLASYLIHRFLTCRVHASRGPHNVFYGLRPTGTNCHWNEIPVERNPVGRNSQ